jgi:hypothetical protein
VATKRGRREVDRSVHPDDRFARGDDMSQTSATVTPRWPRSLAMARSLRHACDRQPERSRTIAFA